MRTPIRIGNDELASALAENLDDDANDIGLDAEFRALSPEAQERSEQNLRDFVLELRSAMGPLGLRGHVQRAEFQPASIVQVPRHPTVRLFGVTIRVASIAALVRMKRAAGRPKDLAVLPALEAALKRER